MHKLGRGKMVLIYAGEKGHTHAYTHSSVHILDKRAACIVYNMYAEDNANSSPKNNTLVGLCNFFRFVLFASFPPDVCPPLPYYTVTMYPRTHAHKHTYAYAYVYTFGDNLKHCIPGRYNSVPPPPSRLLGGAYARRAHTAIYVYTTKRG